MDLILSTVTGCSWLFQVVDPQGWAAPEPSYVSLKQPNRCSLKLLWSWLIEAFWSHWQEHAVSPFDASVNGATTSGWLLARGHMLPPSHCGREKTSANWPLWRWRKIYSGVEQTYSDDAEFHSSRRRQVLKPTLEAATCERPCTSWFRSLAASLPPQKLPSQQERIVVQTIIFQRASCSSSGEEALFCRSTK